MHVRTKREVYISHAFVYTSPYSERERVRSMYREKKRERNMEKERGEKESLRYRVIKRVIVCVYVCTFSHLADAFIQSDLQ